MTFVLALTVAVLYGTGAYLLLQRNLSRIVIGLGVLGHGANLLLLMAGRSGNAPIVGDGGGPYADPLPQALALTAIVIAFGVSAYLLALVYRSWLLTGSDEVEDDVEDQRIAALASRLAAAETAAQRPGEEFPAEDDE